MKLIKNISFIISIDINIKKYTLQISKTTYLRIFNYI